MEVKTEYRTSAQVARVFRMTSKNVQRLTADGVLETVETPRGRRYDWDKTVEMYVAYLSDKASGREKKETTAELKELQGKMHRAEDVEAIMTDHALYFRSMLMAMPGKLAVDLAGTHTAPEQADRVKREVYFVLNALADYRYDPEVYKARVRERQGWNERHGDDEADD